MKNKNKVSLCSKPITFALSLTPPFHTESLRGSEVLSQCKRSQLIQQFPEPTHVCQLPHLPFEISNLKSQICNSSHDLDINDFAFSAFVHFFAAIFLPGPFPPLHLRAFALDFPILTVTNAK